MDQERLETRLAEARPGARKAKAKVKDCKKEKQGWE